MRCAWLLFLLVGCAKGTPQKKSEPSVAESADAAPKTKTPKKGGAVDPQVLKQICASDWGRGEMSEVELMVDASGELKVLALRPDLSLASHPPHTYYAPDGTELLVVPERPVTEEERATDPTLRKLAELTAGLAAGGSESCSDHR